ncbi:hypothetical protein F4W66_01045 [Escherichia coli]|nr:hypothetical protein F4W66_01045 [Escherichia coli]
MLLFHFEARGSIHLELDPDGLDNGYIQMDFAAMAIRRFGDTAANQGKPEVRRIKAVGYIFRF